MCRYWKVFRCCSFFLLSMTSVLAQNVDQDIQHATDSKCFGACDFDGFLSTAESMRQTRKERLITAEKFAEFAKDPKTVILDARSEKSFDQLRVRHSINLPYTLFSRVALEKHIPDSSTRILIFCRNNIEDSAIAPVGLAADKSRSADPNPATTNLDVVFDKTERLDSSKTYSAGLNIPVAITLKIYGYENVWELDEIVDPFDTPIDFIWSERFEENAKRKKLDTSKTNEKHGPKSPKTGACDLEGFIDVAKTLSQDRKKKWLFRNFSGWIGWIQTIR